MKSDAKGFFLVEVLVALALAAIFSGIFVNFFMQSWNVRARGQKRTEMLSKILLAVEKEKLSGAQSYSEHIKTKELFAFFDANFKQNMQNVCGARAVIPDRFALKEYTIAWENAERKTEHITIVGVK